MRTYLPLLIVLIALPAVVAEEKKEAAKSAVNLSGKSNEELRKLLKSDDAATIVAAQSALEKRDAVKPEQLARDMVPLLFHKSEDVRKTAHRIVARHGWDGITAAHIAKLSRPTPKLRDIQRLVNQSEKTDVLTRLAGAQVKGIELTEPKAIKSEPGSNAGIATVLQSWVETPFQFFRFLSGDSSGKKTAKEGKTVPKGKPGT